MFRTLDYQDRVLKALDEYLAALKVEKKNADAVADVLAKNPGLKIPLSDFPKEAWAKLESEGKLPASRADKPFSPRLDGCKRPVPNVVLKVPTGGGKTFLATQSLSRIFGQYLNRNAGFVLWIVPNEAIYSQTLRHLKNRQHVYRQVLDRAAAGRVRILEKTDRLDARDIEGHLCVMLLMLQSANRETNDTLRMFRDRGDVHGFTPPEGEQDKHKKLFDDVPNLDGYTADNFWPEVKSSLGNALRIIRPVVVMDEGHKATSDLAFRTLYGFNPCFVLELTATPKDIQPKGGAKPVEGRYANVLVEVTGKELDQEGMIKMPLNLDPRQGANWKQTLAAALDKLNTLDAETKRLQAETGRYIRPIMLVQVERTGKEQRDSGHIHADDARDWLKSAGLDDAEIAIKTAETNDLNQPENLDLLSPTNRVRAIITKSALQEGWDCPFAYVLCSLAAQSNLPAMTQLVGRILRQPDAMKTNIPALDECYVITHHAQTGEVVKAVKNGLEADGLGDLTIRIEAKDVAPQNDTIKIVKRRAEFAKTEIYLPKVLVVQELVARDLDYEGDILANIDWRGFDPTEIANAIPEHATAAESQLQRISLTEEGNAPIVAEAMEMSAESVRFDASYAVRMIGDIVPNPFVAREIIGRVLQRLRERGFDEAKVGGLSGIIIEMVWRGLERARDAMAEALFRQNVANGGIQFRLRLDGNNWRMPFEIETKWPEKPRELAGIDLKPVKRSLFEPVLDSEFNGQEKSVAVQLDGEAALKWWHRNVARAQYGIQGWKRHRIYPDFIFAVTRQDKGTRFVALETKGEQLDNPDTAYKREVLKLVSAHFGFDDTPASGTLELVRPDGETMECHLVLMQDIPSELPKIVHGNP